MHELQQRLAAVRRSDPADRLGAAAEVLVAVLVITCTFVTTERPMGGHRGYPIMLGLLGGSVVVVAALHGMARRMGVGTRRGSALGWAVGGFLGLLAVAALTLPFHDHVVLVGAEAVVRQVPTHALVVPLVEAALVVVLALGVVTLVPQGRTRAILWRTSVLLAVVTPIDLAREFAEDNLIGWRFATRLGGASTLHVVVLLALGSALESLVRRRHVVISALTAGVHAFLVVATGSRAGLIDLAVLGLGLLVWGLRPVVHSRRARLTIAGAGVLVAVAGVVVTSLWRRGAVVDGARATTWATAWHTFTSSPGRALVGAGYGVIWPWYGQESGLLPGSYHYQRQTFFGLTLPHAHNTVIQVGAELGLVGLALLLVSLGSVVWACLRALRGSAWLLGLAVLATLPGLVMDTYLVKNFPVSLLWWLWALAVCRAVQPQAHEEGAGSQCETEGD